MATLSSALQAARRHASWDKTVAMCRKHPVRELLHEDPLTARAFAISRGYHGRSELLDIIYDRDYKKYWRIRVTPLGDAIFRHTVDCQAPEALRRQRSYLAGLIDETCKNKQARILSAACGHLRELELSHAVQSGSFGRFVGLDADPEILTRVRTLWGPQGVEAMQVSLTAFLANPQPLPQFDLVYAAGLFDHLDAAFASVVLQKLIDMVHPGGRLVISNVTTHVEDAGYMEAFMGWRLVYRDAASLLQLVNDRRTSDVSVVPESSGAIIHLDVRTR